MIPLSLALELKQAGLVWRTSTYDFFAIPEHQMDDRVFVLADMVAFTELVQGWPAVAFHGAAEWALDYIFTHEIVWMPTEEQLRETLQAMLAAVDPQSGGRLVLQSEPAGYSCAIGYQDEGLIFTAATAGEAYAQALLHVLRQTPASNGV